MGSALTENENRYALSKVRIERARELVAESERLLNEESFKSANNRAYYAIEKSIKALLAIKGLDAATHNGVMKLFNLHYIHQGDGSFYVYETATNDVIFRGSYFEARDFVDQHTAER